LNHINPSQRFCPLKEVNKKVKQRVRNNLTVPNERKADIT
jgi:hypothetical protein